MIPEDYKIPVQEKPVYELLPDDTYEVEISKIDLRVDQPIYMKPDEVEDKFNFEFVILDEGEFKGRKQWKEVRTVMSAGSDGYDPSWLYKIFCAVNNVKLTDDDAQTVSVNSINDMIGKRVRVVIVQKINKKGVMVNNIANFLPLKGTPVQNDSAVVKDAPEADTKEEGDGWPTGEDTPF